MQFQNYLLALKANVKWMFISYQMKNNFIIIFWNLVCLQRQ